MDNVVAETVNYITCIKIASHKISDITGSVIKYRNVSSGYCCSFPARIRRTPSISPISSRDCITVDKFAFGICSY